MRKSGTHFPEILIALLLMFGFGSYAGSVDSTDVAAASNQSQNSMNLSNHVEITKSTKVFYFGHSLLLFSNRPDHHIPYNVGYMAKQSGHDYAAHGQTGWGTLLHDHWGWDTDDLEEGPGGFSQGNREPFYSGQNAKKELATGEYDFVVFTESSRHALGADTADTVNALVNFIKLARKYNPDTQAILYSCWNPLEEQIDIQEVTAWRDQTLKELEWWEQVADQVNVKISGPEMLLVPASLVFAEVVLDSVSGEIPGMESARNMFIDHIHATSIGYYVAALPIYAAMFKTSPIGITTRKVRGEVNGVRFKYSLPSEAATQHIQQVAWDVIEGYSRAGF